MPIKPHAFYMIRHGETDANAAHIMAGSLDAQLTQNGRDQAFSAQKALNNLHVKPGAIIHSHLSRARDTAHILNEVLNLEMIEDPDLAELHAGDWEGVPYAQCPDLLDSWTDPPNGETFDDFTNRVKNGKNRYLGRFDSPVLIVSHGGVFRAFGRLYGLNPGGSFKNCHLHEFQPNPSDSAFPWTIWQYDQNDETVQRRPAENYDMAVMRSRKSG